MKAFADAQNTRHLEPAAAAGGLSGTWERTQNSSRRFQDQLEETESQINASRRDYNAAVQGI